MILVLRFHMKYLIPADGKQRSECGKGEEIPMPLAERHPRIPMKSSPANYCQ